MKDNPENVTVGPVTACGVAYSVSGDGGGVITEEV